jgi:hypothetical protein
MSRAQETAVQAGKGREMASGPTPPEQDTPIWEMTEDQLSGYRRALIEYLRQAPASAPRYMEMRAHLGDVIAERQIRKIIEHFQKRTGTEPTRPPARAGLDTARAGPDKGQENN